MTDITKATPPQSPDGFTFDLQRFAAETWDGTVASSFSISDDTANTITINSAAELALLAKNVNGGNDYSGWTITLGVDLNLNGVDFTPIGKYNYNNNIDIPFKGTFDGGGYTISNLTINGSNCVGLFGYVGTGGTIKNVTLENATINGNSSVGGLIGYSCATVENCSVIGGKVTGEDGVGGLVGDNNGTVSGNTAFSTVSGAKYVGGLVGYNNSTVSGNTAIATVSGTGNYIGGLVGFNFGFGGTVTDNTFCSNYGAINNWDDSSNTRLYTLAEPDGVTAEFTGGDDYKVTINGTTYYKSGATFKLTVTDFPNGQYLKGATADDGTFTYMLSDTTLEWADLPTIEGLTFDRSINGFKISTAADLQSLATYVNAGNDCAGLNFKLTDNIDLSTVENFAPIGKYNYKNNIDIPFKGTFDGGGYTISNLKINSEDNNVGLFGYVGEGGTIKNVKLTDVDVTGGDWNVGGFVGYNEGGTVENCSVIGGKVTGKNGVGGLIGENDYTVTGCTVDNVSVTATYANGDACVGGLVGDNYATVSGNIVIVSNISHQRDNDHVGGLVGDNNYGTVSDNYYYSTFAAVGDNNNGTAENNTLLNKVTLPGGVTASGDTCFTVNGIAYAAGNITLSGKTGYVYSGTTSATVTADIDLSTFGNATFDTENHYVLANNTSTLATADNTTDYPDLIQVYELSLTEGVTATAAGTDDLVVTIDGTTYAAGNVTLSAAEGYTLQNVSVGGESLTDNLTFTVDADATITADSVKFGNGGKSVEVGGTTGDFSAESGVYSITASQENSTVVGNTNNNNVIIAGGGENILTGGGGNDTYKFSAGGGIVTDYGIGSTKDSTGKTLSAPLGSDVIKIDGKVSGVYFDRDATSKKTPTFTAVITYGTGDDTDIIVLQNINKKPTKYSSDPSKVVYQTNDVAAATLKIWDTSGSKQAVLSASKLKALFHDDSELSDLSSTVQTQLVKLDGIGDLNLPAVDQLNQNTQATFNGGE